MLAKERRILNKKTSGSEVIAEGKPDLLRDRNPISILKSEIKDLKITIETDHMGGLDTSKEKDRLSRMEKKMAKMEINEAHGNALIEYKERVERSEFQAELKRNLTILENSINWDSLNSEFWEIQRAQEEFEGIIMVAEGQSAQHSKEQAIDILDKFFTNKEEVIEAIAKLNAGDLSKFFKEKYDAAFELYTRKSSEATSS